MFKEALLLAILIFFKPGESFTICACERRRSFILVPDARFWSRQLSGHVVRSMVNDDDEVVGVGIDAAAETNSLEKNSPKVAVKCPDCDLCDGSGRILGGLGAILPWMPVKAYRPCPNFINRGGNYERTGQRFDEIAFGEQSRED